MIFTSPALCSEYSLKLSTKSSSRDPSGLAIAHVPRSITSSDTRRGSSSRSMRFHSKNLAVRKHLPIRVSEPTRLSVSFEATRR
jgi:hypothetical protein